MAPKTGRYGLTAKSGEKEAPCPTFASLRAANSSFVPDSFHVGQQAICVFVNGDRCCFLTNNAEFNSNKRRSLDSRRLFVRTVRRAAERCARCVVACVLVFEYSRIQPAASLLSSYSSSSSSLLLLRISPRSSRCSCNNFC